jgi:hypothetical protein
MAAAQRQIRNYGGVMTRLNIFPDFRKFFEAHRTGVYNGAMCNKGVVNDSETVVEHAVVLVGYDNINEFCESSLASADAQTIQMTLLCSVCHHYCKFASYTHGNDMHDDSIVKSQTCT